MSKINILHLCKYFTTSSLYQELFNYLSSSINKQYIVIPTRNNININLPHVNNIEYYHLKILKNYNRIFYKQKIKRLEQEINNKFDFNDISLVHAHTWFSDGGVAYLLNKNQGLKYIVTVRNTDINIFWKYMPYLRRFGMKILENAERIVFISPAYHNKVQNILTPPQNHLFNKKSILISNGIDNFWLENNNIKREFTEKKFNLIYVGKFRPYKNLKKIIELFQILKNEGNKGKLFLIGNENENKYSQEIIKLADKIEGVNIINKLDDPLNLLKYYRKSDIFVMPSFYETFGLVYVEAMSQGLPIIYTQGQGIDGYFPEGYVGYSVNPYDINDLVEKVRSIILNYYKFSDNCQKVYQKFSWIKIVEKYNTVYSEIL